MGTRDPRFDAYIAKAAPFARPILKKLRKLVHAGCPGVVETMKWSSPAFEFHGPLAQMAAFKAHCTFGFWKGKLVAELATELDAMGQFGRITSLADLPPDDVVIAYARKAAELNATGVKLPTPKKHPKPPLAVPADLAAELAKKKHAKAQKFFATLSPSHQREYIEWITEAKREETRAKRLATTLEWLGEGKARNWKYERY
jgi:uncharacterized protein YdeI (YjbR/CyaY-like superfamily)